MGEKMYLLIIFKVIFYIASFILALNLNFFYYQLKNKSKINFFEFYPYLKENYSQFKLDDRFSEYLVITIPSLSIWIRNVYCDLIFQDFGQYVFIWQAAFYLILKIYFHFQQSRN